ncbi:MAG: di-heme oxidoredictase family protein, partial [Planctomycetota bacterium]
MTYLFLQWPVSPTDFNAPQLFEVNSGGATTVRPANLGQAFMQPAANLSAMEGLEVHAGAAVFDRIWISAPSGNIASDGLGPLYNSRACVACHRPAQARPPGCRGWPRRGLGRRAPTGAGQS